MEKNISINISGVIFHIEEDAYKTLREYLDRVQAHFASVEDSSEIVQDIESRLAEVLSSRLRGNKQVVTQDDVLFLIQKMGDVKDFEKIEKEFSDSEEHAADKRAGSPPFAKKFYRDEKDRIIGGVCSGIGYYFNIDPVWVRLLFIVLAVISVGALILIYVIFWIATPSSKSLKDESGARKMFRDPENKVVGGVASGIAAFLGIDTLLIRILFIVSAFLGLAGVFVYLALWVILPEAHSATERMQMHGKFVTLSDIEEAVRKRFHRREEKTM